MIDIKKNKRGFTLIELLIASAIMSILVIFILSFMQYTNRSIAAGQNLSDVQYNMRMAASYITNEIRNAESVDILSSVPASFDSNKKYIYVDGNTIKYYMGGDVIDILHSPSPNLIPEIVFEKNASNVKMLHFKLKGTLKQRHFEIESEIAILNMKSSDYVTGAASGPAISFGPFTDSEVVQTDQHLFQITDYNPNLIVETSGEIILPPPPVADLIIFPGTGTNNSAISWTSSDQTIVRNDGVVFRPTSGTPITLTAIFSKGEETSAPKTFTLTIMPANSLIIANTNLPAGKVNETYSESIIAIGGNNSYNYSLTGLPAESGLTLDNNGVLSGVPTVSGAYSLTITVTDSGVLSTSRTLTLQINN